MRSGCCMTSSSAAAAARLVWCSGWGCRRRFRTPTRSHTIIVVGLAKRMSLRFPRAAALHTFPLSLTRFRAIC